MVDKNKWLCSMIAAAADAIATTICYLSIVWEKIAMWGLITQYKYEKIEESEDG